MSLFPLPKTNSNEVVILAFTHKFLISFPYYPRGDKMDKDKQEKQNQKRDQEQFNSITQKVKPENQNQTHNVRSEAIEPKIRQV